MSSFFESDPLQDFLATFLESPRRWPLVKRALQSALSPGYLESDPAAEAIAAAELLTAARGFPHPELSSELSPELAPFLNKPPKDLAALTALASGALRRIRHDSELAELYSQQNLTSEFHHQIDDLLSRLQQPARPPAPLPKFRKIRTNPGDVFQIELPTGQFAYGRLTRKKPFPDYLIYSAFSSAPSQPPIGSRDFLFSAGGLHRELERGLCPIVGNDPWHPSESDPLFIVHGIFPNFHLSSGQIAPASECLGLPRWVAYDLPFLIQRILEPPAGPLSREEWPPPLPSSDGVLRSMPWSAWNPQWSAVWHARRLK